MKHPEKVKIELIQKRKTLHW